MADEQPAPADYHDLTREQQLAVRVLERARGMSRQSAVAVAATLNKVEAEIFAGIDKAMQAPPLGEHVAGILTLHADRLAKEQAEREAAENAAREASQKAATAAGPQPPAELVGTGEP